MERASDDDDNAPPLDFNDDAAFLFVGKDLDDLMESLDARDVDAHGRGEGRVLGNRERLDNNGYLSEGEEGWYNLLGDSEENEEGGRGGDNNDNGETDDYDQGSKKGALCDAHNLLHSLAQVRENSYGGACGGGSNDRNNVHSLHHVLSLPPPQDFQKPLAPVPRQVGPDRGPDGVSVQPD